MNFIECDFEILGEPSNGGHILSSKNLYVPFFKTGTNGKFVMARIADKQTTDETDSDNLNTLYEWEFNKKYNVKLKNHEIFCYS